MPETPQRKCSAWNRWGWFPLWRVMQDEDSVLLDAEGKPADKKAAFELERKVIGKRVTGFRFCNNEEFEPGRMGVTVTLEFEDGEKLMIASESGRVVMYLSMKDEQPTPRQVM